MSAAPWTPGSWRVVEEDDAIAHWYRVEVGTPPRRVFKMSDAADARLIAAAPEMAALLGMAHDALTQERDLRIAAEERQTGHEYIGDYHTDPVIARTRALLARIRGETP